MTPAVLLAVAGLIVYGSLYPFHFVAPPDSAAALQDLLFHSRLSTSFGDLLGNVGLFVPFGLVGAGAFARKSSRGDGIRAAIATLATGLVLAAVLQVIQIYLPDRTATMGDVVWNTAGIAIGLAGAELLRVAVLPHGYLNRSPVPVMLLLLWVLAELAPLIPQLDVGGFKDALKPLLLHPSIDVPLLFYAAAQVLLVARLVAEVAVDLPTLPLLLGLLAAVVGAKPFIETQTLDLTTILGFAAGFGVWVAGSRIGARITNGVLLGIVMAAYTLQELSPFQLRDSAAAFSWLPFAASLEGSMLSNLQALASSAFTLVGCAWLIRGSVTRVRAGSAIIAAWALLLELAQTWIVGRSAGITESIIALAAGFMLPALVWPPTGPRVAAPRPTVQGTPPPGQRTPRWSPLAAPGLALAVSITAVVVGMRIVLRHPAIPYNVSEMFVDNASLSARFFFALAVLWIGAGAMLLAHALTRSRRPYLLLPLGALVVAMVSKFLIGRSLSYESIDDVLGSDTLFRAVTGDGSGSPAPIWGPFWQHLFLQGNAASLVDFLERRVRYTAFYSPPIVCMALALTPRLRARRPWHVITPGAELATGAAALLWLVLCHVIVWPWAGTDNLTELLASGGPFEYAHALYLYGIVVVAAMNVALLVRACDNDMRRWLVAIVFSIAAVPIGWFLLTSALDAHVQKYGAVFSAPQFVLGPDRRGTLSDGALFARWAFLQLSLVAAATAGAWIGDRLLPGLSPRIQRGREALGSPSLGSVRNA